MTRNISIRRETNFTSRAIFYEPNKNYKQTKLFLETFVIFFVCATTNFS
jgi:hypothetical protein